MKHRSIRNRCIAVLLALSLVFSLLGGPAVNAWAAGSETAPEAASTDTVTATKNGTDTDGSDILLRGLDGEMARITGEDLRVTVDLSGITEPGVHTVPVTVQVANYANVGVKGSYQIVVDVERLP